MFEAAIIRIQVNDPSVNDSYNLVIDNTKYDLIELLTTLDGEEQDYLLDALDQARDSARSPTAPQAA